ncbi:MAG: hypothetical protein COB37_06010 [Kordiimonadales bacterium]|nr:MAG: hypothetical protein COB37_06010 [Kordiimonadales bacterium]
MRNKDQAIESKFDVVSMTSGYWYAFEDGDDEITINISSWSGKGRLFINDELVFEGRGFGVYARYRISHAGKEYDLRVCTVRVITSDVEVMLSSGNRIIGVKTSSFYGGSTSHLVRKLVPLLIVGFAFGILGGMVLGQSISLDYALGLGLGLTVSMVGGALWARYSKKSDREQ